MTLIISSQLYSAIPLSFTPLKIILKNSPDGVTAIRQAVDRGAGLVRQILTFARKTDISFEPLSISELVKELVSMLQQTFPKIITFNTTDGRTNSVHQSRSYTNASGTSQFVRQCAGCNASGRRNIHCNRRR